MKRWPQIFGIFIGATAAMIVLGFRSQPSRPEGPMLSECDGAIRELVIHYVSGDTIALPVYRSFLPQLPTEVTVYALCPDEAAFDELRSGVGSTKCALRPIIAGHPITVWSRDRWVALESGTLLSPRDEEGAATWPARAGDAQAASDIARALSPRITATRISLHFDGGDFLSDGESIFVTPAVLAKNLQRTVASREDLLGTLTQVLGRKAVLLENAPDHHAGMYMMAAGKRTMLVGDPSLARNAKYLPIDADFSQATQDRFDAVASQLAEMGYKVVRIPTAVSSDAKTYLTYVNVITDHRNGRHTVYMPIYDNADELNQAAAQVWQNLGYEIRPINCTSCYRHFGTMHCLVNVLTRNNSEARVL